MIHEPHYWTDPAASDTEEERICEEFGVGPALARRIKVYKDDALAEAIDWEVAQILSKVLSDFCRPCKNLRARVYGLIFAAGLDMVNGIHSQAEIAKQIGCTRALISHYTTQWADKIRLGVFKFRKAESSRPTFRNAQLEAWKTRKY
jgi:hypothetical protein